MAKIELPYGKENLLLNMGEDKILALVKANPPDLPALSQEDAVKDAVANPLDSKPLSAILNPGDRVCLIVPDITRLWESPFVYAPILLDEMNKCGIKDEDITILCATGTHRKMSDEEHAELLGSAAKRARVFDHQCLDMKEHKYLGTTKRGTPVYFDRRAVEADKLITACGVVYHFLAGFGGGAKALLPGISANDTIQHNHSHALNDGFGSGMNMDVRSGNLTASNPIHADMVEAAAMLPPDFSLNVVVDDKFRIIKAYAGDWKTAHLAACKLVGAMDGVKIPAKSDFIIASAGGSPKDVNLYQGVKLVSNALAAAKPGSTIILVAKFPDGFGNEDTRHQICDLKNMEEREKELRSKFSIGAFAGYLFAEAAELHNLVVVTDMPQSDFAFTRARAVKTLDEALVLANSILPKDAKAIIMPHGATTVPIAP